MTPAQRLKGMLDAFDPAVVSVARGVLTRLRRLLPGAIQLIYDNPYALVVGFGASDRASEAVLSVVIFPRHVTLCFIWGAELDDPGGLLKGGGRQVRHIRLAAAADLDRPGVKRLIRAAIANSETPFKKTGGRMEVRAVSARKRPRRPTAR